MLVSLCSIYSGRSEFPSFPLSYFSSSGTFHMCVHLQDPPSFLCLRLGVPQLCYPWLLFLSVSWVFACISQRHYTESIFLFGLNKTASFHTRKRLSKAFINARVVITIFKSKYSFGVLCLPSYTDLSLFVPWS